MQLNILKPTGNVMNQQV